jgi:membrane protease YdiL (CAAX protease family)
MVHYLPAAVVIAVIEEGFFRAFLLGGLARDLGCFGALIASSAIFAVVHVVRSPARFYLMQFAPMAGVQTLAAYLGRMFHAEVGPPLLGLFLLGMVLGEAFVLSGRTYWSLGLHVGFVLGAKSWRLAVAGKVPRWLAGPGPVALIAAPAAWAVSVIMLLGLRWWLRPGRPSSSSP